MMRIIPAHAKWLLVGALLVLIVTSAASAAPPFKHKPHEKIACLTCHEREDGHGAVKITIAADCTGCHHSRRNLNVCTSCHTDRKLAAPRPRTLRFQASTSKTAEPRTLSFAHRQHAARQCAECHSADASMRVTRECTSCHADHHAEQRNCTACHVDAGKVAAHDNRSHLSCAGAGCHQDEVTLPLRTQRNVCLACHSNMATHEPAGDCASCHMIPRGRKEKQ